MLAVRAGHLRHRTIAEQAAPPWGAVPLLRLHVSSAVAHVEAQLHRLGIAARIGSLSIHGASDGAVRVDSTSGHIYLLSTYYLVLTT